MTDEVGCKMRAPPLLHGIRITSVFLQRLGSKPPVDYGITTTAKWHENIKGAFPSVLRTIIESVEMTVVLVLARLISVILALPLPFRAADRMACVGLDFFESLIEWKDYIIHRLREWISTKHPLTSEEAFLEALLSFEGEMKRRAVGRNRKTVQGYLDVQMGLFDGIDDSIESLHQNWVASVSPDNPEGDSELKEKHSRLFRVVQRSFEEALGQRNILTWVNGRLNPLEPVWGYLHNLAKALNPTQATLPEFSKRIYFMRVALRTTIHQIKQAAETPGPPFYEEKIELLKKYTRLAGTWLLNRALIGFAEVKLLIDIIELALNWLPAIVRQRLRSIREHVAITWAPATVQRVSEPVERIELTPPESEASSDTAMDSDETVVDAAQYRQLRDPQLVIENEVPASEDSNADVGPAEGIAPGADENSDQHSNSEREVSPEPGASNEGSVEKRSHLWRPRLNASYH